MEIEYFDKHVLVNCPIKEELFGMKICALIDRSTPRDLYDVKNIMTLSHNLNMERLRKSTLFYLSLDGILTVDENTFNGIKAIGQNDIKRELVPVLSKGDRFNFEETKEEVIEWLKHLLSLSNDEKKYFEEFSKGNYNPSLLFDFSCAKRIMGHPMARWRISNLQK